MKALEVGIKASMPRARREYLATDHGKQESKETLIKFLHWLPTARPEYENLTDNEDLNTPDERTRHYAYENNLIVLLADAWKNSGGTDTQTHLADTIQKFNLNRADAANTLKKDLRLIDDRDHMYGFTRAKYPRSVRPHQGTSPSPVINPSDLPRKPGNRRRIIKTRGNHIRPIQGDQRCRPTPTSTPSKK